MNSSRPGPPVSKSYTLPHAPYMPPCGKLSGVAWQRPQQEEFAQKEMQVVLRLPTTPTVQGGWTTCARVRRLSMPIACLSSAMASASHGTGHGVAVGRGRSGNRLSCVGRFFRFRPLLSDLAGVTTSRQPHSTVPSRGVAPTLGLAHAPSRGRAKKRRPRMVGTVQQLR